MTPVPNKMTTAMAILDLRRMNHIALAPFFRRAINLWSQDAPLEADRIIGRSRAPDPA
jgi:hypothetical protein